MLQIWSEVLSRVAKTLKISSFLIFFLISVIFTYIQYNMFTLFKRRYLRFEKADFSSALPINKMTAYDWPKFRRVWFTDSLIFPQISGIFSPTFSFDQKAWKRKSCQWLYQIWNNDSPRVKLFEKNSTFELLWVLAWMDWCLSNFIR